MSEITVNLVGAGRVGQTLLRLVTNCSGYRVQDVVSGRAETAEAAVAFAGAGQAVRDLVSMRPADIWIIAVPDTQILPVSQKLAEVAARLPGETPVAFHCSGFYAAEALASLREFGWPTASVHPVLTFADPETAVGQFEGTWCGAEGDSEALIVIEPLLTRLGARVFPIRSEAKSLYHAAAVISNNFTVVLQALAREAWAEAGVPDDVARSLNSALLRATYENVAAYGPQTALTGPAARGDTEVVVQQGHDVSDWHPEAGKVYRIFSDMASSLKTNGTTKPESASGA